MCPAQTCLPTTSSRDDLRKRIVAEARTYLGTPWRHNARSRDSIDCIGLTICVAKTLGLTDYPDQIRYKRIATAPDLIHHYAEQMVRLPVFDELLPGDIVVMRGPNYPNHVAFIGDRGERLSLIHATVGDGKVVEDIMTDDVRRLFIAAFRFKELVE